MKNKLIIGSLSGVLQIVVNSLFLIVLIPLFIKKLGVEIFGVYALIITFNNLNVLTNFGFSVSLLKDIGEQGKSIQTDYDILASLSFVGFLSFFITSIFLLGQNYFLQDIMRVPYGLRNNELEVFYRLNFVSFFLQNITLVFAAILDGKGYVYINNIIQLIFGTLFNKGGTLVALLIEPSLKTIAYFIFLSSILNCIFMAYFALRYYGKFEIERIEGKRFYSAIKKNIFYSKKVTITSIITLLYEPMTKVLIGKYLGVTEVGYYDIGLRARSIVGGVLDKILYPLVPFIASISDKNRVKNILVDTQRKLLIVIIPSIVACIFMTDAITALWIGINERIINDTIRYIMICNLLSIVFAPIYQFLMVKGYPEKTIILQMVNVVLNLLLFFILVPLFRYYGALSAYCIALVSSVTLCLWYEYKLLQILPIDGTLGNKLSMFTFSIFSIALLIVLIVKDSTLQLVLLIIGIFFTSLILIKSLSLLTKEDIIKYLGENIFTKYLLQLLPANNKG